MVQLGCQLERVARLPEELHLDDLALRLVQVRRQLERFELDTVQLNKTLKHTK